MANNLILDILHLGWLGFKSAKQSYSKAACYKCKATVFSLYTPHTDKDNHGLIYSIRDTSYMYSQAPMIWQCYDICISLCCGFFLRVSSNTTHDMMSNPCLRQSFQLSCSHSTYLIINYTLFVCMQVVHKYPTKDAYQ